MTEDSSSPTVTWDADATEAELGLRVPSGQVRNLATKGPPRPRGDSDESGLRHVKLEQTRRQLREILDDHEGSTEDFNASNEKLQGINQELRSAAEELEAGRNVLQSNKEELMTVNQGLERTIDELGHANGELENLLGATTIATLFVDRELRVLRFTPPAAELFSAALRDVGRLLSDLHHCLDYPDLLADVSRVLRAQAPIEREVSGSGGRHFLARLLPYITADAGITGAVLTFVNVTDSHVALRAAQQAAQELEERVEQRTAELAVSNRALRKEVQGRLASVKTRDELQRRLLVAQEQERSRISRELHDEVGQQVSALLLALQGLESAGSREQLSAKVRELRAAVENVGRELHQLAYQLRPLALDELGLARALNGLAENWRGRTGLNIQLVTTGIDTARLPPDIETTIYRIVQEAMNNVHKHAAAQNVSIIVELRRDEVIALVEDDGVGADLDSAAPESSDGRPPKIGISGMRERAALVRGELTLESTPGGGTTVRVCIPLPPKAPA